MKIEVVNVIIGATLSFIATIIWDTIKFNREYKFNSKNKLKHLNRLLKESTGQTKLQIKNIENFINELDGDEPDIPKLVISAFNSIDYLSEKILNEEYYLAYMRVYKNIIGHEDDFFQLKYTSVYLSTEIKHVLDVVDAASKNNHERKIAFNSFYQSLQDATEELLRMRRDEDRNLLTEITAIYNQYLRNRTENGGIKEIYDSLILPLVDLDSRIVLPFNVMQSVHKMHYEFNNILFQKKVCQKQVSMSIAPLTEHFALLKEVKNTLDNNQIRSLL